MKRRIVIEFDDSPSLIDDGNCLLEIVQVRPFDKVTHRGWILTLRDVKEPTRSLVDWVTLETNVEKLKWQVARMYKFLTAAGFAEGSDPKAVTHKDLIGMEVWARIEQRRNKNTGEFQNRVKYYLTEPPKEAMTESEELD